MISYKLGRNKSGLALYPEGKIEDGAPRWLAL